MKKYHIVVLLLLALLLSQFNVQDYILSMKNLTWDIWTTLIIMQLLSFILLLIQWKRISLALGKEVTFKQMVSVNMKGVFYETITPGLKVGGEVAKAVTLVNEMDFTSAQASALVVIQKCISISALIFLSVFSFVFLNFEIQLPKSAVVLIYFILVALLLLLFVILFIPEKLYNYLLKSKSTGKIVTKTKSFLEKYTVAFNRIKNNKKEIFFQFLLSLVVWALFPFKLYYIVSSLGWKLSFIRVFAVTIISYVAGMVPLLPGGLGSFEGTMVGLFLLWGINKEQGLVIATIFRFITFWLLFFISIVYLIGRKAHKSLKGALKGA
ncbi:MAG: flippase-like domain-containing protein [Tissierellia bacterium]|nr:flippase-like domain-containing protein [Tissierellia bacterium]